MFDFPVKGKYEVQDDYATRLFLFTHKENIPVGDFTRAINEGKISRRSMENLISGIEQRDGKFTRLLDGDELTAYLNKLKRALRNSSKKNKILDEKIEAFLDGNYRVLVEYLEKLKEKIINFYQYRNLKVELINLNFLNMLRFLIIFTAQQERL